MSNKWKYLDKYVKSYKDNDGCSEREHYLPLLVIYFRYALDKIGANDAAVPEIFDWDNETAEDFGSWGHNSRWSHTFNSMLYNNLEEYVNILKDMMESEQIQDFDVEQYLKEDL